MIDVKVVKELDVMKQLVGLEPGEASIILEQFGYIMRVIEIGEQELILDTDNNSKRVNVVIKKGRITAVNGIY